MKTCPRCGTHYEDANTLCPADGAVLKKDDALVGNTLTDKYRIEEKIAEGGMGCVYRATHVLMEKTVAIKVLHPALAADEKIVARFTREAKAASRISHPHALTVTDFGEDKDGVVFLVMEYLRGRTLKETIRQDSPMPLRRVVEIVRQVCGALEAAHAEGIVHRDLKSDNIMLEESSAGDWAKVLDFGIAKIKETAGNTDPALTAPNLIIGTPQYMSPEQCSQASEIDSRSDIYSLGVILYEMLAGHVPFTGDSPTAIMMKHLQEPPPSILDERADLPPEVGRIVARALAKSPDERYQKAGQLSDALAQAGAAATAAPVVTPRRPDTDRIIVSTAGNEAPRVTERNVLEEEEATVVSAEVKPSRDTNTGNSLPPFIAEQQSPPPAAQGLNPWRIALPAIAALAVIFAVVYALQSRGPSGGQQPLTTDPNSQPVQSITPPSGAAETSVTPSANGGVTNFDPNAGQIVNTQTLGNTNQSTGGANPEATPTPARAGGGAQNTNQDAGEEEEDAGDEPTPQPTASPANRNANNNRRAPVVTTTPSDDDDDAPPPPPPARRNPPASSDTKPAVKIEAEEAPPAP